MHLLSKVRNLLLLLAQLLLVVLIEIVRRDAQHLKPLRGILAKASQSCTERTR